MVCSAFVNTASVAALMELDRQLKELLEVNDSERVLDLPFDEFRKTAYVHPGRFASILKKRGVFQKVTNRPKLMRQMIQGQTIPNELKTEGGKRKEYLAKILKIKPAKDSFSEIKKLFSTVIKYIHPPYLEIEKEHRETLYKYFKEVLDDELKTFGSPKKRATGIRNSMLKKISDNNHIPDPAKAEMKNLTGLIFANKAFCEAIKFGIEKRVTDNVLKTDLVVFEEALLEEICGSPKIKHISSSKAQQLIQKAINEFKKSNEEKSITNLKEQILKALKLKDRKKEWKKHREDLFSSKKIASLFEKAFN